MQKSTLILLHMYTNKGMLVKFLKNLCINRQEVIAEAITDASEHLDYVESINPHISDSLHWNINKNYPETISTEYFRFVKPLIRKQRLGTVQVIADITEDNFYGKHTGLYIHNWKGENGVKAKFKYLVVSILHRNKIIPFYIELLPIGVFKADSLGKAIQMLNSLGIKTSGILLDRGFYSGDIINTLQLNNARYLIFVPKNKFIKKALDENKDDCIIEHEIRYSKNKTKYKVNSDHVLIHEYMNYSWVFATNVYEKELTRYVSLYKKRWNIETMFRVHDEGKIRTKSIKPEIRLFYFSISMLLLLVWNLYHKTKMTFRSFIKQVHESIAKAIDVVAI